MSDLYRHPPVDPEIARIVDQLTSSLEDLPQTLEQCRRWLEQGYTLGELRGISEDGYTALYTMARELCDQGNFHHALPIALQLAFHQPTDKRFPFIAGACLQRLGHPQKAALMYALASDVDTDDAASNFRLAECLLATGHTEEAKPFLHKAIDLSYGRDHCRSLQERARKTLEALH